MNKLSRPITAVRRSAILILSVCLALGGCGLGMSAEDKVDRAQQALDDGEYRAAIIDAKAVLQQDDRNARARVVLGEASVAVGDGATGEKELRRAIDLGANPKTVSASLGRALLQQGKFEDALELVRLAEGTDSAANAHALQIRGEALLGMGRPSEARAAFEQALAVDADNLDAQLGVVNSYFGAGEYMQARQTMDQVLASNDTEAVAWLASGGMALYGRDLSRAAGDFRQAADIAGAAEESAEEMVALSGLADALMLQSDAESVRPVLARMQAISPDDSRTLLVESQLAMIDGRWIEARTGLLEVIRRMPGHVPAQTMLGIVEKERGNIHQAEMYLSAAVAQQPTNINARRHLAEVRIGLDRVRDAREVLQPVVSNPGADSGSLVIAANASRLLGDMDDAVALLEQGIANDPANPDLKFQLALAQVQSGDLEAAKQTLASLSSEDVDPSDFRKEQLLVVTELLGGDAENAVQMARRHVERVPNVPDSHLLLGIILRATGDIAGARRSLNEARTLAPGNEAVLRNLARLDLDEENLAGASERLEEILALDPTNVDTMIDLAGLAVRMERQDEAIDWLVRATETAPEALRPRLVLAAVYNALGRYSEARALAEEAIDLAPESAEAHSALATSLVGLKDFTQASSSYAKANDFDSTNPDYRLGLARASNLAGDADAAEAVLKENMDATLRHLPSAVALASLYADEGNIDEALAMVRSMRSDFPGEAIVPALEGELHAKRGDFDAAVRFYDEALALENAPRWAGRAHQLRLSANHPEPFAPLEQFLQERPLHVGMRSVLARAYMAQGDTDEAVEAYQQVLELEDENLEALNNLAFLYQQGGDSRAEEHARRALAVRPDNSSVQDTLGWILVNEGKLDEGLPLLRKAASAARGNPEISYHLAFALVEAGEPEEAKRILEGLVTSDEDFAAKLEAEQLLERI